MKVNLNDTFIIGTEEREKNGKLSFAQWAKTNNKESFIAFCQYVIDSCPDPKDFRIIHAEKQLVFDFIGVVKTIGLKSSRYNTEE